MEAFNLKRKLLLGAANGGVRSDGVCAGHVWGDWYVRSHPRDTGAFRTADHWENWREDVSLMHSMALECCRFVVDWARIEPEQDVFDDAAIAHVREELIYLRAMGIRPMLVLHEFSDPVWFAKLGGWSKPDNVRLYLRYVEKLIRTMGHLVEDYVPVSQPNLFAWSGWHIGAWPPGQKSAVKTRQVMSVLCAAHIEGYRLIHALRGELGLRDTRVGASVYMRMHRGKSGKQPLHLVRTSTLNKMFLTAMSEAMVCGKFGASVKDLLHAKGGSFCDFHDLCCYALPDTMEELPGVTREPSADEVLYCAAQCSALLRRPIFITEGSGLTAPSPQRIYDCVRAISDAGLPIERYHAMAFTDGFEWSQGAEAKLGLVAVELTDASRQIRPAGVFMKRLIRNRGVTEEMCREYAPAEP